MGTPTLLIIEDDDYQYELYEETLTGAYRVVRAIAASEALTGIATIKPSLILLDHILARGERGLDFLAEFRELVPYVPIIIVSGALEVQQQMEALQGPRRAHFCISKPVDLEDLKRTIEVALRECGESEIVRQFEALERSKRVDVEDLLSRSTDRLSRQSQIRQLISGASERPNISALARQFRVARRTIIRDLQELIRRGEIDASVYPKWETEAGDVGEG